MHRIFFTHPLQVGGKFEHRRDVSHLLGGEGKRLARYPAPTFASLEYWTIGWGLL